ncbi:hypothetical protein AAVH_35246 [Aphelenchoides avenae]|nr:hypothetical protein AAVH_35246 [Aphelenchus avenae]
MRNTIVHTRYLDVVLNSKTVTEWKSELERYGVKGLNCTVQELDTPTTADSIGSLLTLWDMLKPHNACNAPSTLGLRLEQVVMPTFAHHYVDPSSVLKTALYEACLKGRLFADRLKLRFYFANSSTANEIVKFFTSLSDTRGFPEEVLISFVETPELTRYDYARQQRIMWPDCENHPTSVSNAHCNVTVFQPFRNPSTSHKMRVIMHNRYSPCNRNLPDFAYPQASSTTSSLILVSDSPLYYNEEHKSREVFVRNPQPKRQWSEEHIRRNLHQRATGRLRMACSPIPNAAVLAPVLAVKGLTEMACRSQSEGCVFRAKCTLIPRKANGTSKP